MHFMFLLLLLSCIVPHSFGFSHFVCVCVSRCGHWYRQLIKANQIRKFIWFVIQYFSLLSSLSMHVVKPLQNLSVSKASNRMAGIKSPRPRHRQWHWFLLFASLQFSTFIRRCLSTYFHIQWIEKKGNLSPSYLRNGISIVAFNR